MNELMALNEDESNMYYISLFPNDNLFAVIRWIQPVCKMSGIQLGPGFSIIHAVNLIPWSKNTACHIIYALTTPKIYGSYRPTAVDMFSPEVLLAPNF